MVVRVVAGVGGLSELREWKGETVRFEISLPISGQENCDYDI